MYLEVDFVVVKILKYSVTIYSVYIFIHDRKTPSPLLEAVAELRITAIEDTVKKREVVNNPLITFNAYAIGTLCHDSFNVGHGYQKFGS